MNNASGSLLAQYTASDALANEVLAASADLRLEVTRIVICNTSGAGVAASLFHDDSGTSTFGTGTALLYAKQVPANDYLQIALTAALIAFFVASIKAYGWTAIAIGAAVVAAAHVLHRAAFGYWYH